MPEILLRRGYINARFEIQPKKSLWNRTKIYKINKSLEMYFSLLNFIFFKKKLSSIGFTAQFDKKSNLELKSTQRCWSTFLPFYANRVNRKQFRHGYLTIGLGPNRFILICRIESKIRKRF